MKKELRTTFSTRQYMLSKDFEIYYYNDRNLPTLRDHTHNYYEFYFLLGGEVSIHIDGITHPLKAGDMILIPPGLHHHVNVLNPELLLPSVPNCKPPYIFIRFIESITVLSLYLHFLSKLTIFYFPLRLSQFLKFPFIASGKRQLPSTKQLD